ncbi:hypothetical protein H6G91_32455 [Nostoc muscorum FACHB-395]|nr:hypothetical protein [Desmonostoc muscorum FACHB-395]
MKWLHIVRWFFNSSRQGLRAMPPAGGYTIARSGFSVHSKCTALSQAIAILQGDL